MRQHQSAWTPTWLDRIGIALLVAATVGAASAPAHGQQSDLLVSSANTAEVLRYDGESGAFVDVFAARGELRFPLFIVFGPDGNLYASEFIGNHILRFDGRTGASLGVFAAGGGLRRPIGLVFGPDGHLYVSSQLTHEILRYDGQTGTFLDVYASGGGLNRPSGLKFGADGHLYVASFLGDAVLRFDGSSGAFIEVFAAGGGMNSPRDIVFGPDGHLYVSNFQPSVILRYDGQSGAFIDEFAADEELEDPNPLIFGPDGHLYVCEQMNDSVLRFDGQTGELLDVFATSNELDRPSGLTFIPTTLELSLDIKPGSCPNPFNRNSNGVLPVALAGTEMFDVADVDLDSILLSRADGVGGGVAPHQGPPGPHTVIEDVATPFDGEPCDCHEETGDGIDDLSMKFPSEQLVSELLLDDLPPGALLELTLTGAMLDGTEFQANDCIRLGPPGTPPRMATGASNLPSIWIDAVPLDE